MQRNKSNRVLAGAIISGLIYLVCMILYVEICTILWNVDTERIISHTGYSESMNAIEYGTGRFGTNKQYYLSLDNGSVISFSETLLDNAGLSERILSDAISKPLIFCYTSGLFPNNHLVSIYSDEGFLISQTMSMRNLENKAEIYLRFANVAALFVFFLGIVPALIHSRWWNKAKQKLHWIRSRIKRHVGKKRR